MTSLSRDEDCEYCRCAAGEHVPGISIVYDDGFALGIMYHEPLSLGHLLLIPREHHEDLLTAPNDVVVRLMSLVHTCSGHLVTKMKADGLNILVTNGAAGFQTTFHLHIHMLPRFVDDGILLAEFPSPPKTEVVRDNIEDVRHCLSHMQEES